MDTRDAGQMGGKKTLETQGIEHFRRISKIAAEKRTQKAKERKQAQIDPLTSSS